MESPHLLRTRMGAMNLSGVKRAEARAPARRAAFTPLQCPPELDGRMVLTVHGELAPAAHALEDQEPEQNSVRPHPGPLPRERVDRSAQDLPNGRSEDSMRFRGCSLSWGRG